MSSNYIEALNRIRSLDDSLQDAKIKSVTISKTFCTVYVEMISNRHVDEQFEDKIASIFSEYMPNSFKGVKVSIAKIVADEGLVKNAIIDICTKNYFCIAHSVNNDSIVVSCNGDNIQYILKLKRDVAEYFERSNLLSKISDELSKTFCNEFVGSVEIVGEGEEAKYKIAEVSEDKLEKNDFRVLKVADVTKFLDDEIYDTAVYISDYNGAENYVGVCYIAGEVINKEIKTSKKGNDYFSMDLNDKTGKVNVKYFTTAKEKVKKMEKIEVGSQIICRCESSEFNGRCSLVVHGFNLCELPKNFKMEDKPDRIVPTEYERVFPVKAETINQDDMFTVTEKPSDCLIGKTFVVVDVETTGTELPIDRVTEVAAVKVVDGVITEYFTSLINPETEIPEKIIKLTGIDDNMVKDAPKFSDIGGEFLLFLGNGVFVAHNADFDSRFIRKELKNAGYSFNPPILDTLALARETVLGLKNYKLNTICEKFGIEFRHHRALSDAYATAEMFIKLINIKKSLPNY